MKGLFTEKFREDYLRYYGMDAKKFFMKRVLFAVLFGVIGLVLFGVIAKPILILLAPIGAFFGYKMLFIQLVNNKKHDDMMKTFIFPQFLRYFISLIGTQGNVYQTLKATAPYLHGSFREKLEEFIGKIEQDNDFTHYTEFAEYIGTNEASMVLSMIYDFSEHGIVREELEELERTIDKLNENKTNQMVKYKTDEQEKYMNMPIFASIFFTMAFAVIIIFVNFMQISKYMQF